VSKQRTSASSPATFCVKQYKGGNDASTRFLPVLGHGSSALRQPDRTSGNKRLQYKTGTNLIYRPSVGKYFVIPRLYGFWMVGTRAGGFLSRGGIGHSWVRSLIHRVVAKIKVRVALFHVRTWPLSDLLHNCAVAFMQTA
jgi:hypothetical protein